MNVTSFTIGVDGSTTYSLDSPIPFNEILKLHGFDKQIGVKPGFISDTIPGYRYGSVKEQVLQFTEVGHADYIKAHGASYVRQVFKENGMRATVRKIIQDDGTCVIYAHRIA
jgi:uncharacterized Fe-S center protein